MNDLQLFNVINEGCAVCELIRDTDQNVIDFRIIEINPTLERLLGIPHNNVVGRLASNVYSNEYQDWIPTLARVAKSATPERVEQYNRTTGRWFEIKVSPMGGDQVVVLFDDITERKKVEEALRLSEQRLQRVLETDAVGVLFFDQNGYVIQANHVFLTMTGYSREQIARRELTWRKMTPPEWIKDSEVQMERLEQTGHIGPYEKEYFLADGSRRWMLFAGRAVGDGTFAEYCIDISDRKRAEEALRLSEERFRFTLANSPVVVANLDKDLRYTWIYNPALDLKPEAILGKTVGIATDPETTKQTRQRLTNVVTHGASVQWEMDVRLDTGIHSFETHTEPLRDARGEIIGVSMLSIDITERKQTENRLREYDKQLQSLNKSLEKQVQEKTVEVRKLAVDVTNAVQRERNRISHILHDDLQQRIYAIHMQLTLFRNRLQNYSEEEQREASDIEAQLLEVLEITRHLSVELSPPILREEGLAQAIGWLAHQMFQRYGLTIEVQADEPFAVQDEALHVLLFSCVREMLFNTVKHAEASHAIVALRWVENCLEIRVQDNGRGFPAGRSGEQRDEERTSPSLGIPTIRQQLSLFGGTMDIQSAPATGTSILITVPIPERS